MIKCCPSVEMVRFHTKTIEFFRKWGNGRTMKTFLKLLPLAILAFALGACQTPQQQGGEYDVVAYAPQNPENVRVKVSLDNRAIYVMEGDRPLLVTAAAIGRPDKPTPTGEFRVTKKENRKRSGSYGFWTNGDQIVSGTRTNRPGGANWRYVGYPMQYWVEWMPLYGFHSGAWPPGQSARSAGCIRLHRNVAPKFYALTRIGTPVSIQRTQPEDQTLGRNLARPQDYNPDHPRYRPENQVSPRVFDDVNPSSLLVRAGN